MLGDGSYHHEFSVNTFSKLGKSMNINNHIHYVHPHSVKAHYRGGQFIQGYWRDGDGNSRVDRATGWTQANPYAADVVKFLRMFTG